jgi:enamine deaminase RidA (YjgF/YER057c/UK114 family)
MEKVQLKSAPAPKGHYSPAVVHNGLVYVSGQLPRNAATGEVETGAIEAQTELALWNVEQILFAANSDLNHVLQMTIYVSEMELWDRVNEDLRARFGRAQAVAGDCSGQGFAFRHEIEIQAIAAVKD